MGSLPSCRVERLRSSSSERPQRAPPPFARTPAPHPHSGRNLATSEGMLLIVTAWASGSYGPCGERRGQGSRSTPYSAPASPRWELSVPRVTSPNPGKPWAAPSGAQSSTGLRGVGTQPRAPARARAAAPSSPGRSGGWGPGAGLGRRVRRLRAAPPRAAWGGSAEQGGAAVWKECQFSGGPFPLPGQPARCFCPDIRHLPAGASPPHSPQLCHCPEFQEKVREALADESAYPPSFLVHTRVSL